MKKEPTVTEIALRAGVRCVLSALPRTRRATRAVILAGLHALGHAPTTQQLDDAIEWNHSRNFIDYRRNHDIDQDEWFLTDRGRQKEGLR